MARRYSTKIIPPEYEQIFERKRLLALVERKKAAELLWVNGAPGAGKTVFVANLLKHRGDKFLWYRIDSSTDHFADIFYFLGLAGQRNYPGKDIKLPVFTAEYADNIENFSQVFFRELFAILIQESAVILDDCQELEHDPKFFRLLQIAVDQLPHGLQLICVSRNRPGIELGHLSLSGRLLEINNADLRFTNEESEEFLRWLDPSLNPDQVAQIRFKAQGWAAGMILLTRQMAMTGETDNQAIGENLFDFLVPETLSNLPRPLRLLLTSSAIFTQFTANMSMELVGYHQAKADLDTLTNRNFLIERTSGSTPQYRLHPLFRELLLKQAPILYKDSEWQALQLKAAQILMQQDRILEALPIYQQSQDWPMLQQLLLQEASQLINTGRYSTLREWLEALPAEYLETDARLNYWYALTIKPSDPLRAESYLEKSYQHFILKNDTQGIYSSWIDAVESIMVSWDDFSKLKVWMDRFDSIRKDFSAPTIELKIRFYATATQALSIYNAQHSWLKGMIRICENFMHFVPVRKLKMMLSVPLGHYYLVTCQLAKMKTIEPLLISAVEDKSFPALTRIMSAYILVLQSLFAADTEKTFLYTHKGLELSELSGINLLKEILLTNLVGYHISNHDLVSAEEALENAIRFRNDQQRMVIALHLGYEAWISALSGNPKYAAEQAEKSLQLSKLTCMEAGYISTLSTKIQLLAELKQWQKAEQALLLFANTIKHSNNRLSLVFYYIAEAWLAYLQHDESRSLKAIRELLQILRAESIFAFFGWRSNVITAICVLAIENDIDQEFAVKWLAKHRLNISPPVYLEQWPWPVKIYSFDALTIVLEGKPIEQSGKSQKKILELLEMLINLGGRNVHCDHLASILWPDAEGDLARQALETSLYRLRKLIGKDAIVLNASLVSLNSNYCWLDLWAFEATALELEQNLVASGLQPVVDKLTNRLLTLYRGMFLKNTDSGLVILKQEQLLNKLCRVLDLAIDYYTTHRVNERICQLLHKQLEFRPMFEANYRRLMNHYANLGQLDEALEIYRQCQRVLCKGFNKVLSGEIQLLAKQLQHLMQ